MRTPRRVQLTVTMTVEIDRDDYARRYGLNDAAHMRENVETLVIHQFDRYGLGKALSAEATIAGTDEDEPGGITPEAQADGHRYVMGEVNAYCPRCTEQVTEREGRKITVLDCYYDTEK